MREDPASPEATPRQAGLAGPSGGYLLPSGDLCLPAGP